MEKHMIRMVAAGVVCFLLAMPAAAQTPDSVGSGRTDRTPLEIVTAPRDSLGIDTLRRIDTVGSELVQLREGGGDGSMILEVGGFGLKLGTTYMSEQFEKINRSRFWLGFVSNFEFGFTQLTGVDYGAYTAEQRGFLDQRLGASFHFSFSMAELAARLNQRRSLILGFGLQYTLDNIRLADPAMTLGHENGRIVPSILAEPADKSKIVCSYLGVPLRLYYIPAKHVKLTAVLYNDFLLGADAIYKAPKKKHGLSGFRGYQFGIGAAATYRGIGCYVRYSPTPLFKNGAGPECRVLSFGFSWTLYL